MPYLKRIEKEVLLYRQHRLAVKQVRCYLENKNFPLRLELGSAGIQREGWIGIDITGAKLGLDLRRQFPFPDNSVDEIHSEHFFEHLLYPEELMHVLKECFRVLKPGKPISFSVPNMRPYFDAYCKKDIQFLKKRIFDVPQSGHYNKCAMDLLNWFALRRGEHKFMFDDENAILRLKEAGFINVRVRDFDPQRDYNQRLSSLYIEGTKPLENGNAT
jgi:predicted SAM-dependent methyltransferase